MNVKAQSPNLDVSSTLTFLQALRYSFVFAYFNLM